ncbi:MAG: radical SAM protein [Methanocellales archaeon]|nr:radical SAM protein [Methanocellales archaeon]
MSDVVLIRLEDPHHHQFYPPLGLLYVASALMLDGFTVKIFHEKGGNKKINRLRGMINDENPFLVAFSVFTGPHLYYNLKASEIIKEEHGVPVVWGGIHPTILPEVTINVPFIDYVVIGEGEETIVELAERLRRGRSVKGVNGLCYKENGNVIINEWRPFVKNLDRYVLPWELVDVEKYVQKQWGVERVLPIITSRGCPYDCGFCYNTYVHKRRWRAHSPDYVISQVSFLKERYDIQGINFYDANFFTDKSRAFKILSSINMPWAAEVRADEFDMEFGKKMKEFLCRELFIGAESGSDRVLKIINKEITTEQIDNAVKICNEFGIRASLSFMLGIPGETEEDIRRTVEFMYDLKEKYQCAKIFGPKVFTPYPGTPLYPKAIEFGLQPPTTSLEWARNFHRFKCNLPWVDNKNLLESLYFICQLAQMNAKDPISKIIKSIEDFRWKNQHFKFLYEIEIVKTLAKSPMLVRLFFKHFGC